MQLVDAVVKVGGSLLRDPSAYETAVRAVVDAASTHRLAIVPGGGPFVDLVRLLDRALSLGDEVAHWLAIRGMDAHAELLVSRMPDAALIESLAELAAALAACQLPVLAPSRWLREHDPLPHSWDVSSDSIAAWIAGQVGASKLLLLKPVAGEASTLTDPYFERALPKSVQAVVIGVDELASGRLRSVLSAVVLAE